MRGDHPPFYPPFLLRVPRSRGCVFGPARVRVAPEMWEGPYYSTAAYAVQRSRPMLKEAQRYRHHSCNNLAPRFRH